MKKLISLLLVLTMVLCVAAFAEDNPDGLDDSLLNAESIKIGYAVTLTGASSTIGVQSQRGLELAVNRINEAGGIYGKPIEVITYDDGGTSETAIKVVTRLIEDDDVDILIGPFGSNSIMACGDYIEEAEVPMMGVPVGAAWLRQGWTYLFRATASTYSMVMQAAELIKSMDVKTLAIYNVNEEYGNTSKNDMIEKLKADNADIEIVLEEVWKNGDTDYTSQSARIAEVNPDAVYVIGWANDLGALLKQLRQGGYEGIVVGDNAFTSLKMREVAGEAANGAYFTAAYILPSTYEDIDNDPAFSDPLMNDYLHLYYDNYGELPTDDNAFRSFDAINIIAEGIKIAKSLDGEALRDAFSGIHDFQCLVGTMDYRGNNGEGITGARMYVIEDGKSVEYFIEG